MVKDLRKYCEENGFLNRAARINEREESNPEPVVYTTKQIAHMLCMSEQSVRNLIKGNNIPTIPGTKNILVRKITFDNFISQY